MSILFQNALNNTHNPLQLHETTKKTKNSKKAATAEHLATAAKRDLDAGASDNREENDENDASHLGNGRRAFATPATAASAAQFLNSALEGKREWERVEL